MNKLTYIATAIILSFSTLSADSWQPLFGKHLEGARYNPQVWSIDAEGIISATQDESLWTEKEYEHFELSLEFKNDVATNSGVIVYCSDTKDWIPNSVEIQILDDYADKWKDATGNWKCGAVFGHLAPAKSDVVKPAGEWNTMRICCKGKRITVYLNDKKVNDMDMSRWTSGTHNPDGSEIPSWLPKPFASLQQKGYIGFQGKHGDALIWFRNIRIRSLQ